MEIWYCEFCEEYKSRSEVQDPTKGGIMLIGRMECKICKSELFVLTSTEVKVQELNYLKEIRDLLLKENS
jgi:hypothetical protein